MKIAGVDAIVCDEGLFRFKYLWENDRIEDECDLLLSWGRFVKLIDLLIRETCVLFVRGLLLLL